MLPLLLTAKLLAVLANELPWMAAVVVMVFPVEIVPNPEAIEPAAKAPTPVMLVKLPLWRSALTMALVLSRPATEVWTTPTVLRALRVVAPALVRPPVMLAPPLATVRPVRPVRVPVILELPMMAAPPADTVKPPVVTVSPVATANVPVKLAAEEMVWPLTAPLEMIPVPALMLAPLVTMPPLVVSKPVKVVAPTTANVPVKLAVLEIVWPL